jgi:hypothetical protein
MSIIQVTWCCKNERCAYVGVPYQYTSKKGLNSQEIVAGKEEKDGKCEYCNLSTRRHVVYYNIFGSNIIPPFLPDELNK